ncbi:MAG: hypothetical protein EB145_10985 [Proteobacteria bacterium]|nr:hypothetical protein [Pseudomonadota bacterium]
MRHHVALAQGRQTLLEDRWRITDVHHDRYLRRPGRRDGVPDRLQRVVLTERIAACPHLHADDQVAVRLNHPCRLRRVNEPAIATFGHCDQTNDGDVQEREHTALRWFDDEPTEPVPRRRPDAPGINLRRCAAS